MHVVAAVGVTASNTGHILCWGAVTDRVVSHLFKKDPEGAATLIPLRAFPSCHHV